jgi:hypothetical protein
MTIQEFRSNQVLVAEMRKLLESDVLKLWLEALETANPANFLVEANVTPHFAHIMLGQQTGYGHFKKLFLTGGSPPLDRRDDRGPQDYSVSPDDIPPKKEPT